MGSTDLDAVVVDALARLERCFRARDVDGAVACFTPDGAVYGDDVGEHAHGAEELRPFLAELFEDSYTLGWEVEETWVRRHGDVVWFVASTQVVLRSDEGWEDRAPFRVSGILSDHGTWLFELFNGTQPALRPESLITA